MADPRKNYRLHWAWGRLQTRDEAAKACVYGIAIRPGWTGLTIYSNGSIPREDVPVLVAQHIKTWAIEPGSLDRDSKAIGALRDWLPLVSREELAAKQPGHIPAGWE